MKIHLIDGSNIFFICWSVFYNNIKDKEILTKKDEEEFFRIYFLKLRQFLGSNNNIILFEGENSKEWRKEIYPEYKATRHSVSEMKFGDKFKEYLKKSIEYCQFLPCKVLEVEGCEGDDCIYTLAQRFSQYPDAEITIVSSDADLTQISLFFKNVWVFHPIKKDFVKIDKDILLKKIFIGDKSDNIKYKNGLGPASLKKMKENWNITKKFVSSEEDITRLKNIWKIVDLRMIPLELKNRIIAKYNNTEWGKPNYQEFSLKVNMADYREYLFYYIDKYQGVSHYYDIETLELLKEQEHIPDDIFPKVNVHLND